MVDDRDVAGAARRTRCFVLVEPRGAGELDRRSPHRLQELLAAEHPLQLLAALALVEQLDARVRRVAGDLLDPEVAVGEARDLRQVRDRDAPVRAREAAQRLADGVRVRPPMPASISSKTIVSPPATAAIASAMRESSPPEAVSAAGAKGRPGFGRMRKRTSSAPVAPRSRSPSLRRELALAEADALELPRDRLRERRGAPRAGVRQLVGERRGPCASARPSASAAASTGSTPSASASSSARASARARAAPRTSRSGSDASSRRCGRARPRPARAGPAPPRARPGTSGARAPSRAAGPRRRAGRRRRALSSGASCSSGASARSAARDEPAGAVALVGRERLDRGADALRELGHVTKPLALAAQVVLRARLEPVGVGDERAQLASTRASAAASARAPRAGGAPRAARATPPQLCAPPELLLADEGVEHVELVARPRETALLELAGHRDQPLGDGGDVLARDAATPRVRARAAVAEDPRASTRPVLVLGPELGERLEALLVEQPSGASSSASTYASAASARRAASPLRTEQQPDRLAEDRLAGAGLAGDRVQPVGELELRLADEHEVLDPQPTKQRCRGSG